MAERLLPRLWVLAITLLILRLAGPWGPLRQLETGLFRQWERLFHAAAPPWPEDFVVVPIDLETLAMMKGDPDSLFPREDAVRVWDRLHALGATQILNDLKYVNRRSESEDAVVIAAIARDHVFLPVTTAKGVSQASAAGALVDAPGDGLPRVQLSSLQGPLEEFAAVAGLGHAQVLADPDDKVRQLVPAYRAEPGGRVLPSLALAGLAKHHGVDLRTLGLEEGRLVVDGLPPVPLSEGRLTLELSTGVGDPPSVSVRNLLDPEKEASSRAAVDGKLVLIYLAEGSDQQPTALGPNTPAGLLHAHAIRQLAAGHAPRFPPSWYVLVPVWLAMLAAAGPLARFTPRNIATVAGSVILLWLAVQAGVYQRADVFLPVMVPVAFVAACSVALIVHHSVALTRRAQTAEARADAATAPTGEIALVFTDVQGSTSLWERIPDAMRDALAKHNELLRERAAVWRGYEVKTEGDAFMLAFKDPADALTWCLEVQARLLTLDWPAELLAEPDGAAEAGPSGAFLWRGLRVRMGIHVGTPEPRVDPKTGRMDYFGPVVNKAARVSGMAHGGQVILSGSAWEKLAAAVLTMGHSAEELGMFALKGISAPEPLHAVVPKLLAERTFGPPPKPAIAPETKASE